MIVSRLTSVGEVEGLEKLEKRRKNGGKMRENYSLRDANYQHTYLRSAVELPRSFLVRAFIIYPLKFPKYCLHLWLRTTKISERTQNYSFVTMVRPFRPTFSELSLSAARPRPTRFSLLV